MKCLGVAAVLVLAGAAAGAAEEPALAFAGGVLTLSRLPPVLGDEAVAPHLQTGLTTVFLFTLEGRGTAAQKGAAQVAVRYDLWDEEYRVEVSPARSGGDAVSVTSVAASGGSNASLVEWWRASALRLAAADGHWQARLGRVKLTLQVLPFSQAEQRDAQEWLLRSFRAAAPEGPTTGAPSGRGGDPGREGGAAPVREFYGAMLASSIGRRSLISWSWNVVVETR